jgi:sulfur transfer protein SufE
MRIRAISLVIACTISGCASEYWFRDQVSQECSEQSGQATSRAAICMSAAALMIAEKKKETPREETNAEKEEAVDLRLKKSTP